MKRGEFKENGDIMREEMVGKKKKKGGEIEFRISEASF